MKILAYQNNDGKIGWVVPTGEWSGTDAELVDKVIGERAFVVHDETTFPSDFTFYDAWELGQDGISTNIPNAKAIWKNKWREARKPKLEALDVEFMKAVEAGDLNKQAQIASQKQALRDVTLTPINANTPEEIKAVWPEILN